MARKVVITSADERFWDKLKLIEQFDPSIGGGIERVVLGHRVLGREAPLGTLFREGFEEVHEIEPGFCVHITDAVIDEDWRLTAKSAESTLRLRIAFAGEAGYSARDARISDESTRCSFMIRPPEDSLTAIFRGHAAYRYIALSLSQSCLTETLQLGEGDMPGMLTAHWSRRETAMGHFPLSKASVAQAARFFNIRLSPAWHDIAVRTLALDLLRMLFQDWRGSRTHSQAMLRITPSERAALIKVHDLVARDSAAPLTLSSLSKRVRMNRNKLHAGFRQQFGLSIHAYQTELRMQTALRLLQETAIPIAEIAQRTGYGEPSNFTAAFKKHFALLPKEARASHGTEGTNSRTEGTGRRVGRP